MKAKELIESKLRGTIYGQNGSLYDAIQIGQGGGEGYNIELLCEVIEALIKE